MTPAEKIADRYEILDTLGSGGMAAVYLARDEQLDRLVAVKMLLVKELSDGQAIRFQNEAKAIGRLNHSAIMTALDFGVTKDNQPYLVLDYKEGTTLDTILEQRGRLEISEALLIAARVCEGLAYAHKLGVLHRDVKPSNIYLTEGDSIRDSVKILDFGIAKLQSTRASNSAETSESREYQYLTQVGAVIGSPAYMSPEQSRGERVDERSDIYSLGCVLFEMLTGKQPIVGENAVDTIAKKSSEPAPTLSSQLPDAGFPSALEAIVSKSLEIDRAKRFQKADEMLASLESQLSGVVEDGGAISKSDNASLGSAKTNAGVTPLVGVMILIAVLIGCSFAFFVTPRPTIDSPQSQETSKSSKATGVLDGPMFSCTAAECQIFETANDPAFELAAEQMRALSTPVLTIADVKNLDAKNLRCFKDLHMHSVKLQDVNLNRDALAEINEFSKLEYLKMEDCKFESTILDRPEKLPHLAHLLLNRVTLTEQDCNNILKLKMMETLSLVDLQGASVEFLSGVSKMPKLKNLLLEGKCWTVEHIKLLPLINVTSLDVTATPSVPADVLMKSIAEMKRIRFLSLEFLQLKKDCLRYLEPVDTIEFVKLCSIDEVGKEEMVSLGKMKSLSNVELNSLENLSDISPLLASKSLKILRLVRIPLVTEAMLEPFRQRGVDVKVQSGNMGLSDDEVGDAVDFARTAAAGDSDDERVRKGGGKQRDEQTSLFGLNAAPHSYFDKEGVCQLSGSYTEADIKRLAEDIKRSNRTNVGISMTNVEDFRGEWLEYLIPLKPVRFRATNIDFDDTTLRLIGQMTELRNLGLDQNPFRPGSLHYLRNLQKIDHLSMSGVTINDADMEAISCMKATTRIDMKAAHGFSTKGLQLLSKLPHLNILEIGGPTLTLDQTRCLESLKHVDAAELAGRLNGKASEFLGEMIHWPGLKRLTLSSIDLTPEIIERIGKLPNLKALKLYNLSIEEKDKTIKLLAGLNRLEFLELDTLSNLTDEDVLKLTVMRNLKELSLSKNDLVSADAISQMKKFMPSLTSRD